MPAPGRATRAAGAFLLCRLTLSPPAHRSQVQGLRLRMRALLRGEHRRAMASLPKPLARVVKAREHVEQVRAEALAASRRAQEELRQAIRDAQAEGYSLEQVGAALGISRQRVQQLLRGD